MDIGSGIAAGTAILSGGGIIVKLISQYMKNTNGTSNYSGERDRRVCSQHSGFKVAIEGLQQDTEEMKGDIKIIQSDVKELLQR